MRQASFRMVSPSYFEVLGIPILKGRAFAPTDRRGGPDVVIVSEALARSVWGTANAVGKRIVVYSEREAEVIGVAGDVRIGGLDAQVGRTVYLVTTQGSYNFMTVMVRTRNDPGTLIPAMRKAVHELDRAIPLHHVRTMEAIVADSVGHQRFQMLLVSAFSALMLVLAVVGTYGVTAYGVTERTNELGIRTALGATANDLRRLVLGEGIRLAVLGILIGGAGAAALSRTLSRFVFQVSPLDLTTFLAAALLLAVTMLVAAFVPAHRAARTDPMRALRTE
jgi:putative ABC transport system permease protein